jgi:hypothetical protein
MAQVRTTVSAMYLGPLHPQHAVDLGFDRAIADRFEVTRPAGAGFIFGLGRKQRLSATDARVNAFFMVVGVLAGKRPLGGFVPCHVESHRFGAFVFQQGFPFIVGFFYSVRHGAIFYPNNFRRNN